MSIWIRLAVFVLGYCSSPIKESLVKLFNTLEEKAAATGNKLDDYAVGLARFVILGEYTSTETGGMESTIKTLIGKMSEPLRELFYQGLLAVQKVAATTSTPFDDIAVKLLLNVLFPSTATTSAATSTSSITDNGVPESTK